MKDTTGAVLPGVTVEASSPALIEKVKTAATNEAGQYRIVDLRPGTYTVTFTLTGFNTVVREGILLEANFTAPINAEMRVGAVSENVTVTGASPVVDVQTSNRREVVSQQLLEAIPTGRSFVLMANTVPSVSTGSFDVGGSAAMWVGGSLLVHGSLVGRLAHAHRRHGGRRHVRHRPVLLRVRQRSADAGNGRPGHRRVGREPAVGRARQPHSAHRRQPVQRSKASSTSPTAPRRA